MIRRLGLAALRRKKLLTQEELAKECGVAVQTVQAWESGRSQPRPAMMRKLCTVLDVTPDDLLAALDEAAEQRRQATGRDE